MSVECVWIKQMLGRMEHIGLKLWHMRLVGDFSVSRSESLKSITIGCVSLLCYTQYLDCWISQILHFWRYFNLKKYHTVVLQIVVRRIFLQLENVHERSACAGPPCPALRMVPRCMMGSCGYLLVTMAMPGLMTCGPSRCW